jgi:hypothetical protein
MAKISNVKLPDGNSYDIRATAIPYGEVDSTSTSTKYTATVPGITELTDGVCVLLRNGVVTSASGFTININGLGAKPSYSNMATGNDITPTEPTRDTTIFNINYTMLFIYSSTVVDGGCWIGYRGYDANTNTIGYQLRTNSTRLHMSSVTYRYRLLFTSPDGKKYVPANNSTSTNATASRTTNQEPIDPFGRIVYYGTTASVAAGSMPAAAYLWDRYNITLGYSFNRTGAALSLTNHAPVYIKCAPQTNGSAIIDADTPYVQALPSTEDGKIYIFLGIASDVTTVELYEVHPVYYYKDGAIRLWTNAAAGSTGTVTSVGIQNGGGLTVSGSPVTTSGTITVGHSNSVTAQNTQGVYPVTIDANGHIASYGTKEDLFKLFELNTSSYTYAQLTQNVGVPYGTSSVIDEIDAIYDTHKVAIRFRCPYNANDDSADVLAFGTGERFGFEYSGLQINNIMKFTFAGEYSNSLNSLIGNAPNLSGCLYVFPTSNTYVGGFIRLVVLNVTDAVITGIFSSFDDNLQQGGSYVQRNVDVYGDIGISISHTGQPVGSDAPITQAVYPFTVDNYGHLTSVGTAVTIPDYDDFKVTITYANGAYSANKTYAQILAAYNAGNYVYAYDATRHERDTDFVSPLIAKGEDGGGDITFYFESICSSGYYTLEINENNVIQVTVTSFAPQSHTHTVSDITNMPTIPTAGTTATAIGTSSSGGSAATYSKSDHVHSISASTIGWVTGCQIFETNSSSFTYQNVAEAVSNLKVPIVHAGTRYYVYDGYSSSDDVYYFSSVHVNGSNTATAYTLELDNQDGYTTSSVTLAPSSHAHTSSQISDFNSAVDARIAAYIATLDASNTSY